MMAYSGNIKHYLGHGEQAARPATLNLAPGALGIYRADDTDTLWLWDGAAWSEHQSVSDGVPEAPIDGVPYARMDGTWAPVASDGISEAPEDGKTYGRKDGAWSEVSSGGGGESGAPALLLSAADELGPISSAELPSLPVGVLTPGGLFYLVDGNGNSARGTLAALKTFINTDPSVVPSSNPWRGATVKRNTDLQLTNGVETAVPWQAAVENTDSIWSAGNPTRLTVPIGVKRVRLSGALQYEGNTTGVRFLIISKNGSDFDGRLRVTASPASVQTNLGMTGVTADVAVVPGDYFELRAYQTTGGNLNLIASTAMWFSMAVVEAQP